MNQDEIRALLQQDPRVHVQVAAEGDGSPPIAWGDTFFTVRDASGNPGKMPFVTIVVKDYPGFDEASQLDRGDRFRLNIDVGRQAFLGLFGFPHEELPQRVGDFDVAASDVLFPHPVYGAQGWASVINPASLTSSRVADLLRAALARATQQRA